MNFNLINSISQFWKHLQHELFPFLKSEEDLPLTTTLETLIYVLEFIEIEKFIPSTRGFVGRPPKDRVALARSFIAKAVLNLSTTEMLIDRLKVDRSLRRICGFEASNRIPDSSTFSRAFSEFTEMNLPAKVHEELIKKQLGDQIVGHIARDSSAIEAREKPAPKVNESEPEPAPKKRGRPRKGEERSKELTVIEKQVDQPLEESLKALPTVCDVGTKKDSKGFKDSWVGYKIHIDTADGDIPISAILTSASVHDSQVAIPLSKITGERVTYLYDLADAAYCSGVLRDFSRNNGHVPLIDHNPRNGDKIEFLPHETERYKIRSQAERVNSLLKDNHGGNCVRVKSGAKVYTHLMFGILVIAAEQILRLLN